MQESFYLEKDRIPVFIGKEGKQKELFEKKFNSKITINSNTGELTISSEDGLNIFILSNIIQAINLGHSPEHALLLEDENYVIDSIDIKSIVRNQSRLKVVIGRVIGKDGATRRTIEEITKSNLAIKDHFVSFIAPYFSVAFIREALEMLIKGASHKTIYSFLERNSSTFNPYTQ